MAQLKKLEPRHLAAIRMRIEGKPNAVIQQELGVKERTLHIWFSDPIIKTEIERQLEKVDELFAEKLASSAMKGLDALAELVGKTASDSTISDHLRLDAIKELLDRHPSTVRAADRAKRGGGEGEGGGGDVTNNVAVLVANMDDSTLADTAKKLLGRAAGS